MEEVEVEVLVVFVFCFRSVSDRGTSRSVNRGSSSSSGADGCGESSGFGTKRYGSVGGCLHSVFVGSCCCIDDGSSGGGHRGSDSDVGGSRSRKCRSTE